jgi:hypothetical protein
MPAPRVTPDEVYDARKVGIRLLTISEVMKTEKFTGRETDFDGWLFKAQGVWAELGWYDYVTAAEHQETADGLSRSDLGPVTKVVDSGFSSFLRQTMGGEAAALVKRNDALSSFIQWRAIMKRYRPAGAEPAAAMLRAILHPTWWRQAEHSRRPFHQVVVDWENLIMRFEAAAKPDTVSGGTRCATVLAMGPKHVVEMLNLKPESDRTVWANMRARICEVASAGQNVSEYYIPAPPRASGVAPMDVGAAV